GYASAYSEADLQLSNKESIKDTANVLSRTTNAIIIRSYDMNRYGEGQRRLREMAEHASVPVINALDDKDHPCQAMADILTLREKYGNAYKRKKLVVTWAYSVRQKSPGVPHSLMVAGSLLGMNVTM